MDSRERQPDHGCETGSETIADREFDEQKAREGARLLLEATGRDPDESGISDTWSRRVPDMLETLTEGTRSEAKPEMRTFESESDGLVVKTGVPLNSMCEHHMLPFQGVAHVAYRPGEEIVGLSKLIRYVRWAARQLTAQETLTTAFAAGDAGQIERASKRATEVPLATAAACLDVVAAGVTVAEQGRSVAVPDAVVGALLSDAALEGCLSTVQANLGTIEDAEFVAGSE